MLGDKFVVIMPVESIQDNRRFRARVDLSDFLANLLTVARFNDSDQKLWTIVKQVKLQEYLFPSKAEDPELGIESSNKAFRLFDEKKVAEGVGPKAVGKAAANNQTTTEQRVAGAQTAPDGCTDLNARIRKNKADSKKSPAWTWSTSQTYSKN